MRSSTWGNNARRGKCDPWTSFSHKMRCFIEPTSIWAHKADKRGERWGLRSVESRPTSRCRGWQQEWARLRGAGWGISESSRPPPHGVRLRGRLSSDSGPAVPPLGWDTLSGKDGPAPAFPPAWTHLAFTEPDQRIGCWEGCFIMMILNKIISWHVAYTQKEEKS